MPDQDLSELLADQIPPIEDTIETSEEITDRVSKTLLENSPAAPQLLTSGSSVNLSYPSEGDAVNSSWVVFKINTYSRDVIKTKENDVTYNVVKENSSTTTEFQSIGQTVANAGGTKALSMRGADGKEYGLGVIPGKKRLAGAITLYMPHKVGTSYDAQYSEIELGGILGTNINNMINHGVNTETLKGLASNTSSKFFREVSATMIDTVLPGTGIGKNMINSLTKQIENPRKEQMFVGVGFREFEFNFLFTPKDQNETNTVKKIIQTFKENMHPEIDSGSGGLYMNYPNDFDIEYKYKDPNAGLVENMWMHKILTCVLTGMAVDYTPFNQFSTFINGAPVAISMSLRFREIEQLHKSLIKKGY